MDEIVGPLKGDALLIIDVQNDFCPGGALPIEESDKVIPVINKWISMATETNTPVYASRDWHPQGHLSFEKEGGKWPPHCLQDSHGALFHKDLALTKNTIIVTKGTRFDKDQNSAFDETGLQIDLKRKNIEQLFICGLALDVCVFDTVMDALNFSFNVHLILEGTRPVNYYDGLSVIEKMKQAGANIDGNYTATKLSLNSNNAKHESEQEMDVCTKAPDFAEHQRFSDADEPCDDGRNGP